MGSKEGGSSGIWVVSNETQTATRHDCIWSAASPIRRSAAGVGSWQRKTSACASLVSAGGTVAGESVRMYWRMEAISIDVSQELLELCGGSRADQAYAGGPEACSKAGFGGSTSPLWIPPFVQRQRCYRQAQK